MSSGMGVESGYVMGRGRGSFLLRALSLFFRHLSFAYTLHSVSQTLATPLALRLAAERLGCLVSRRMLGGDEGGCSGIAGIKAPRIESPLKGIVTGLKDRRLHEREGGGAGPNRLEPPWSIILRGCKEQARFHALEHNPSAGNS